MPSLVIISLNYLFYLQCQEACQVSLLRDIEPRSPSRLERTETVFVSASLSPCNNHVRYFFQAVPVLFCIPFFSSVVNSTSYTGSFKLFQKISLNGRCLSAIGIKRTCSGASHSGNAPAYFSISRARVLFITAKRGSVDNVRCFS